MPQFVFIPGLLLTASFFDNQIEALLGDTASDPYFGYDIHHAETTGLDTVNAMAERILDEVEKNFIPIGLSMGGYITLELARLAPDRLDAMVVMDSNAIADTPERIETRKSLIEMSYLGKFKGVTRSLLPSLIAPHHLDDEPLCQQIMEMASDIGQDNFVLQQQAIMTRRDQFDTLSSLNLKSLFLVGDVDALTPPEQVRAMANATRGSRYIEIANTGHLPPIESPEATSTALSNFLKNLI